MPVVSLFDLSGNMLRPWAFGGHTCYAFDLAQQNERVEEYSGGGKIIFLRSDLNDNSELLYIICKLNPYILFGFPPCTHLAVSGAKHFYSKLLDNVNFQEEAVDLCRTVELVGECCSCPWMLENPVSMLASLWRSPDYYFDPRDYGGYLSDNDIHPRYPEYIPPRDAYTKMTCVWSGNNFIMPPKRPVPALVVVREDGGTGSLAFAKLGGKSTRTKEIRSETPRGFAWASYESNRHTFSPPNGRSRVDLPVSLASVAHSSDGDNSAVLVRAQKSTSDGA